MTTDLQALIQHLRGGDWNLRAPQEMADMIADKLEAALAAAPSISPAAAEVAGEPSKWTTIQVSTGFAALMEALARAERKGYMPDAIRDHWDAWDGWMTMDDATHHPSPSAAEQAGRWVPLVPTEDMLFAAEQSKPRGYRDLYTAMLAAAPSASPAEAEADAIAAAQVLIDLGKSIQRMEDTTARFVADAALDHPQPVAPAGHGTATLTEDQIRRHMLNAGDCPPQSKVMLVSGIRRLLARAANAAPAVERGVTIERSVAQEIRETLSTYVTTYNDCWERGMDILEPMGDKALALLDAALSTAGKEQA